MDFFDETKAVDVLAALKRQREQGCLCDVRLLVESHAIPVHRCVLAASSDYFCTLIHSDFVDSLSEEYTIPGAQLDAAMAVIDYMYTGEIHICWESVDDILRVADFLCMKKLKSYCSDVLHQNLNDDNCVHIKIMADHFALDDIKQEVMDYLSPRFGSIIQRPEMLDLPYVVVNSFLKEPELNYIREVELLGFILKWINHCPSERKKHHVDLLDTIEFQYLSSQVLRTRILSNPEIMISLSPARTKSLERLVSRSPMSRRSVDDVIVCRSRLTKTDSDVKLLFYYVNDDKWMVMKDGPEPGCWRGLESLVVDQSCVYFLISQTEDVCGYMHQPQETKKLWKLDPQKAFDPWVEAPSPKSLRGQSRLVPHVRGLFAIDKSGVVQKLDKVSNTWANYADAHFKENGGVTKYYLPMPIDKYIYVLRAYNAGYAYEFSQMSFSLDRYDTSRYCWETVSEIEAGDLDLEDDERFHGYTVTPYEISFKNELGFKRAQYEFVNHNWTPMSSDMKLPGFVKAVWGSVCRMDRVYFAGRMSKDQPMFMLYDHRRQRFKEVAPPPECLSGLFCYMVAPRSLRDLLEDVS